MFSFQIHDKEVVLAMRRQAESVLILPALFVLVAIYVPIAFLAKWELLGQYIWWLLLWTTLVFLYAANRYVLWLVTVYLITDKRAVSVRYRSLLHREVGETPLSEIRGVTARTSGVLASLFSQASLHLQSGNDQEGVVFERISKPEELKTLIWQAREKVHEIPVSHSSPQTKRLEIKPEKKAPVRRRTV